jgi:hypothetical protein
MALRQALKKVSVLLSISEPEEISPGVFQTTLTHPLLKGELNFVHSQHIGRDQTLKALDENLIGQVLDLADVIGELIDGKAKKSTTSSPSAGAA